MTDSMDDEQRGRREQSLPQAPASGSGSPPLKKKARGSGTNQSVPLKSGASISCNSSDSSRYGTTAAQALSERQGSAPADNEKPRRKRSLAATSSAAHTPTLHIGVGILDLETSRVRVYSDEDIVHVSGCSAQRQVFDFCLPSPRTAIGVFAYSEFIVVLLLALAFGHARCLGGGGGSN